ncbi:hypothetical protein [Metarhizobium album]|uniref:hypothetical protein n=1 Tax=Metarhizobium album TaxID=2182425 RepID=UPI000FFE8FEB|nr:hypothetical protein [Rhizobium album]
MSHIEIDGGRVTGPTVIEGEFGRRTVPTLIGSFRYFVSVIETDGGRIGMWDGASHEDAVKEAVSLKASFGAARIEDLTGRAA